MTDIFLGIIQGITEFLPISSSGHIVIFDELFPEINLNTNDIAFLHIGTLFSIVIFYRARILKIFRNLTVFRLFLKIVTVGILPAVILGLLTPIQGAIDNSSQILIYTGISYFFLSVLLIFSERITSKNILSIDGSFQNIFKEVIEIFGERKYDKIEALLIVIIKLKNEISDQILTLSNSDVKSKNETLNLEILEKSSMVLVSLKELLENFYSMNSES